MGKKEKQIEGVGNKFDDLPPEMEDELDEPTATRHPSGIGALFGRNTVKETLSRPDGEHVESGRLKIGSPAHIEAIARECGSGVKPTTAVMNSNACARTYEMVRLAEERIDELDTEHTALEDAVKESQERMAVLKAEYLYLVEITNTFHNNAESIDD
tara:strand:- start:301 stop:771 length:471 start_codon:yes stop_codon:yes gene_type:complete